MAACHFVAMPKSADRLFIFIPWTKSGAINMGVDLLAAKDAALINLLEAAHSIVVEPS